MTKIKNILEVIFFKLGETKILAYLKEWKQANIEYILRIWRGLRPKLMQFRRPLKFDSTQLDISYAVYGLRYDHFLLAREIFGQDTIISFSGMTVSACTPQAVVETGLSGFFCSTCLSHHLSLCSIVFNDAHKS